MPLSRIPKWGHACVSEWPHPLAKGIACLATHHLFPWSFKGRIVRGDSCERPLTTEDPHPGSTRNPKGQSMIMELGGQATGQWSAPVHDHLIACIRSRRSHPMAHGLPPLSGGFWSANNTMPQDRLLLSGPMVQALGAWVTSHKNNGNDAA